ncbi:hypothetical protein F5B22DRAFT_650514 [Xylaria bambusicola]|uniref:uncharacterized protein n=1 Tax=Xylaria bambusicola TaxID=326684 RepID=UPI002008B32E|nr:uncharacterized protein F5B22DRAFT_650514 [Xylaria bambusicola]KAI0506696.1 hypothetical protein F5B22DRAFT_650514 [Xylaria bambusicola]
MTDSVPTAQLAIYVVLTIPVLYLLVRHWPTGLLGWFYLFTFTTLRIVGGAISMGSSSTSGGASIISSIGLSPLLLATSGILHEARVYRGLRRPKLEWWVIGLFHLIVATGIALVGTSASALEQGSNATQSDLVLLNIGIALLAAAWLILCFWTATSFLPSQHIQTAAAHVEGTLLLYAIAFSLVPTGIRVVYTVVALVSQKPYLNPVTSFLAIRVILSLLPELSVTILFIVAGVRSRNAVRQYREDSQRKHHVRERRRAASADY